MSNNPYFFWKNFRLGTELQTAGSFLYNALHVLDQMQSFYFEHDCFEFLYHASVGLERMEKIALILLEHQETMDQEAFEKSMITHSHMDLMRRIRKMSAITISKQSNKFIQLLDEFYNSARYDRYNLSSVYRPAKDQRGLIEFVSSELKIEIDIDAPFINPIDEHTRKFLGRVIGKLSSALYELIRNEASRKNMYTYEIASNSKSFKIFIAKQFDFYGEKRMQREAFLYLIKNMPEDTTKKFIDTCSPIEFGQLSTQQYLQSMFNYHGDRQVLDEMEQIDEDNGISKKRIEEIMVIGSDIQLFDEEEDDDFLKKHYDI